MGEICQEELNRRIKLHQLWLKDHTKGERLDLSYCNLSYCNLRFSDLRSSNLSYSNLSYCNLSYCNLSGSNLRNCNLSGSNLSGSDLSNIKYNESTCFMALQCPEKGSFIGYKKAKNKIVELLITDDAKRSSATTRKCRCSKAKVLSIESIDGTEQFTKVVSNKDNDFIYTLGEIVEVKDFNENRWEKCSTGIHFFITRKEAEMY